jgi:hypothetical protein
MRYVCIAYNKNPNSTTLFCWEKRMVPGAHLQLRVQAVDSGQRPPQLQVFVSGSACQLHPSTREEGLEAEWTKTHVMHSNPEGRCFTLECTCGQQRDRADVALETA